MPILPFLEMILILCVASVGNTDSLFTDKLQRFPNPQKQETQYNRFFATTVFWIGSSISEYHPYKIFLSKSKTEFLQK